jgi:hypothetical protein
MAIISRYSVTIHLAQPTNPPRPYQIAVGLASGTAPNEVPLGKLIFDAQTTNPRVDVSAAGGITIYLNLARYPEIMDLLRNEKPLGWFPAPNDYAIYAGSEPIGEQEGV